MPASQVWVTANATKVLVLYRSTENLTTKQIAIRLGTREGNVTAALRARMAPEEYRALKSLKYSASKIGDKNPMTGKNGTAHHGWKGECSDGRGYLTILWAGRRRFVHAVVMMKALGISSLPRGMVVHHINEDPTDNRLDNLALATRAGHRRIHFLQEKDSASLSSRKLTVAAALRYMTSP